MMKNSSRSGSVWLLAMGLALAAAGGVFTLYLWASYQRAEETRHWSAVPCTILASTLKPEQATTSSPSKYRVTVRYTYSWTGQLYESNSIRRVDGLIGDQEKAMRLRESFTPGQKLTCWVNPTAPTQSVLQHDTRAALYSIWFPLLFVLGGLKMAWDAVAQLRPGSLANSSAKMSH